MCLWILEREGREREKKIDVLEKHRQLAPIPLLTLTGIKPKLKDVPRSGIKSETFHVQDDTPADWATQSGH